MRPNRNTPNKAKISDRAATSKRNVALNKADQKAAMAQRKKAVSSIEKLSKEIAKVQKPAERAEQELKKITAAIGVLESSGAADDMRLADLLKAKKEREVMLQRFGTHALKVANKYVAEVRVDGYKMPPIPKPDATPGMLWVLAFLLALAAHMRTSRTDIAKLK